VPPKEQNMGAVPPKEQNMGATPPNREKALGAVSK